MEYRDNTTIEVPRPQEGESHWGTHIELGRKGEECAAEFVRRCGLDILERNWRCPAGEVDIIARGEHSIHFIEVKSRRGCGKGFPEEAVDAAKRKRYERIAEYYLRDYDGCDISVHFDVIALIVNPNDRAFLKLHHNAFSQG